MARIKACYIKEGQAYIEKQLSELHIQGTRVLEYPDRRFYYFEGYLLEVSPDKQKELFKEKNRKKYIGKCKNKFKTVSLENLIADDVQGYCLLIDPTNCEDQCVNKIMGEIAMKAVESLPPDEYDLIVNICMNGMSERTYAKKKGIHNMTIHSRKERILKRLREKIGNL